MAQMNENILAAISSDLCCCALLQGAGHLDETLAGPSGQGGWLMDGTILDRTLKSKRNSNSSVTHVSDFLHAEGDKRGHDHTS